MTDIPAGYSSMMLKTNVGLYGEPDSATLGSSENTLSTDRLGSMILSLP
jgi:hypothetical protein